MNPLFVRSLSAITAASLLLTALAAPSSSVVSLRIDTTAASLPDGATAALNVLPENAAGHPVPTLFPFVHWSVSPTKGAKIAPTTGAFTQFEASRPGSYRITATLGKISKTLVEQVVASKHVPPQDYTTLTLQAPPPQDKQLDNLVGVDNVPKGMPREAAVRHITVPFYPGTHRIPVKIETYPAPIPVSWYLLAAPVRGYYVDAREATVDAWYLNAFRATGYRMDGEGGGPTAIYTYDFTKSPARSPNPLVIGVRTRPQGNGTVVVYGATVLAVPPRPRSSLYPANVTGLVLTYRSKPGTPPVTREISKLATVHALTRLLNAMPLSSGNTYFGCRPDNNQASVAISALGPSAPYPKASLVDENVCLPETIGSVEVVSTAPFWKAIDRVMTKGT